MKNKPKNLDKKDTRDRGLVIALVVVIALLVLVVVIMSFGIANKVEEKPIGLTWNWLEENCECLEFEGELVCLKDFELRGDLCWREMDFTLPMQRCSQFQCPEYLVDYNQTDKSWIDERF